MKYPQTRTQFRRMAMALAAAGLLSSGITCAIAATPLRDLTPFFVNYYAPYERGGALGPIFFEAYDGLPAAWAAAGYDKGRDLPKRVIASGSANARAAPNFTNLVARDTASYFIGAEALPASVYQRLFWGPIGGPCEATVVLPAKIYAGLSKTYEQQVQTDLIANAPCDNAPSWPRGIKVTDNRTFAGPIRRSTLDGFEYEAASMRVQRNGVPWATYYFGYRMGSTAGSSNWDNSNRSLFAADFPKFPSSSEDYELVTLPPPFVEGEVIEYVNPKVSPGSSGGHYFYATSEADKNVLDADENWIRTGRNFKSGGYLPVCRLFYRAAGAAAGTHFFTAKADDCETLKALPGFTFEGTPFRASLPKPPSASAGLTDAQRCPAGTLPLYRFFNNAPLGTYQPNHRYITNRDAGRATAIKTEGPFGVVFGAAWIDEGLAMCVPQ